MRVVIAGGTGFLGSALVGELENQGDAVTVLSRNPEKHLKDTSGSTELVYWDGKTVGDWAESLEGADAIINLVGESLSGEGFFPDRWTDSKKQLIRTSRLDAGHAIVEALKSLENRPGTLIQQSAIGYYGPRGDEIITEAEEMGDDFLAQVCRDWEESTRPAEELGLRRVLLRTAPVLSMASGPLPRLVPLYKLFIGGYFGDGKQWWTWIHLRDVVRAVIFLLHEESASGPFNLTSPNPVTSRQFGKALGRTLSRPSYMPVPGFAMKIMVGEVSTVVLDGQRAIPRKLLDLGFDFRYPKIDEALEDTINS